MNKKNKKILSFSHPKMDTKSITWMAIIMALQIILSKINIGPDFVKISPAFIMTALLGYYFGPWWGGLAGICTDLIGHTFLGSGGTFFIGFTISAFIAPFLYGIVLYGYNVSWQRVIFSTFLVTLIHNLILNTLWIILLYHLKLKIILPIRIIKNIISWIVESIVLFFVLKIIEKRHLYIQ